MALMFFGAEAFNQPLSWNTSSVTGMENMFEGAAAFNQPLSFDISSVQTMEYMFYGANALSDANKVLTRCAWAGQGEISDPSPDNSYADDSVAFEDSTYGLEWSGLGACPSPPTPPPQTPTPPPPTPPPADLCSCTGSGNQISCSSSGLRYCQWHEVCHAPTSQTFLFGEWGSLCSPLPPEEE